MRQAIMISPGVIEYREIPKPESLGSMEVMLMIERIGVSGAGTIGNLVAQFARARGAAKVLISDISDYRLGIARECGINAVLNVAETPFEEGVKAFFGSEGFQVGFEAAGVQPSLDALMAYVEKGGDIVILGVYSENPTVKMFFLGEHELNLFGSMMYRKEDYEEAVRMIDSGKIATAPLISKHFSFETYLEAYQYIEKQGDRTMKVMIDL
ncbi:MAG: zinc-binding dehydrogenase [Bacteroidales bacterium]|nr:zinc-binding dehydrogenase [Bacteroidales bacterium]